MSEWICLRCDWTGGGDETVCPKCGVPLYRRAEPTTARAEPTNPREVVAAARAGPSTVAAHRVRSSPIEVPPVEDSSPPARPATRTGGRWAVIVLALVVTTSVGGGFIRLTTPEPQAPLGGVEGGQETPALEETPASDRGVVGEPELPVGGKPDRSAEYIAKAAAICETANRRLLAVEETPSFPRDEDAWAEAAVRFSEKSLAKLRALPLEKGRRGRFIAYYSLLEQQTLFLRRAATAASAGQTARARTLGWARVHLTHLKDGLVPELQSCPVGLPA